MTSSPRSVSRRTRSVLVGVAIGCAIILLATDCVAQRSGSQATEVEQLKAEVVATYPHDPDAFTQGLLMSEGALFESTGQLGESSIRRVELGTGRVLRQIDVSSDLFAEGLALVDGRLIQLTWKSGIAIVYDGETLAELDRLTYEGEGWGLCYDGERLVMSDGSSDLVFRDPVTFTEIGRITVTRDGEPVDKINELECVEGVVYANIWKSDQIIVVEPDTGEVTTEIDVSGLIDEENLSSAGVLNGIAYDSESEQFYLTGKDWQLLFEVRWVPA